MKEWKDTVNGHKMEFEGIKTDLMEAMPNILNVAGQTRQTELIFK